MIHTRDTPCPWLNACDPNMEPAVFCQSTGYNERFMCIRTCKVELQRVGQS